MTTENTDPNRPTKDPFTSPEESSNVNKCYCCGFLLVPLAGLHGIVEQIIHKFSRNNNK